MNININITSEDLENALTTNNLQNMARDCMEIRKEYNSRKYDGTLTSFWEVEQECNENSLNHLMGVLTYITTFEDYTKFAEEIGYGGPIKF